MKKQKSLPILPNLVGTLFLLIQMLKILKIIRYRPKPKNVYCFVGELYELELDHSGRSHLLIFRMLPAKFRVFRRKTREKRQILKFTEADDT
jgi:hypothetical protein